MGRASVDNKCKLQDKAEIDFLNDLIVRCLMLVLSRAAASAEEERLPRSGDYITTSCEGGNGQLHQRRLLLPISVQGPKQG